MYQLCEVTLSYIVQHQDVETQYSELCHPGKVNHKFINVSQQRSKPISSNVSKFNRNPLEHNVSWLSSNPRFKKCITTP